MFVEFVAPARPRAAVQHPLRRVPTVRRERLESFLANGLRYNVALSQEVTVVFAQPGHGVQPPGGLRAEWIVETVPKIFTDHGGRSVGTAQRDESESDPR